MSFKLLNLQIVIGFPSAPKFIKLKNTVSGIENSDEYLLRFMSANDHLQIHQNLINY